MVNCLDVYVTDGVRWDFGKGPELFPVHGARAVVYL